jgi:protein O-GlcNAc transferase
MKITLLSILFFISSFTFGQIDWDKFGKAVDFQEQKEYDKAIGIYTEILELDSNAYACWYNRGMCFYIKNESNYALHDLYKALNLNQSDSSLFFVMGVSYQRLNNWPKAIEFFNYALEKNYPKSYTIYLDLGSSYYFNNQNDSAIKYLSKAFEINQTNFTLTTNLAFALESSDSKKSCNYFKKAYELNTTDNTALNNYGYSLFKCGDLDEAIKYYKLSLDINSNNSYLYRNIGLYYKATKNKIKACVNLDIAIAQGFIDDWGKQSLYELMEYCQE